MLGVLKWFAVAVAAALGLFLFVWLGARMLDGPVGPFPGGPLRAGEIETARVDNWSFAEDEGEIALQLDGESTSRTTWFVVVRGRAYIPAALDFPPNKSWHVRAAEDGDALLRIDGRRYPVTLRKLEENSVEFAGVVDVMRGQGALPPGGEGTFWLFAVKSRPAAAAQAGSAPSRASK